MFRTNVEEKLSLNSCLQKKRVCADYSETFLKKRQKISTKNRTSEPSEKIVSWVSTQRVKSFGKMFENAAIAVALALAIKKKREEEKKIKRKRLWQKSG